MGNWAGILHACDEGGQPDGAAVAEKTGITKTTTARSGEKRCLKNQMSLTVSRIFIDL